MKQDEKMTFTGGGWVLDDTQLAPEALQSARELDCQPLGSLLAHPANGGSVPC